MIIHMVFNAGLSFEIDTSDIQKLQSFVRDNSTNDERSLSVSWANLKEEVDVLMIYSERPQGDFLFMGKLKDLMLSILNRCCGEREYSLESRIDASFDFTAMKSVNPESKKTEGNKSDVNTPNYEKIAKTFNPIEPEYTFDRVIINENVKDRIIHTLDKIRYEDQVFSKWGLYTIQPHPVSALNFFGPSGTGKTMAAEAVASYLGKKILKISYADIESKYFGEGPKMAKAVFLAAEQNDAVLFIDEADSLLSKRFIKINEGSEQAINSMRSQLLICLESFKGIVIFATNLNQNYDKAFLTRITSIKFELPDVDNRLGIWRVHTSGNGISIPLSEDVNLKALAETYDKFTGRDIRNAVISACIYTVSEGRDIVSLNDFIHACDEIVEEMRVVDEEAGRRNKVDKEIGGAMSELAKNEDIPRVKLDTVLGVED